MSRRGAPLGLVIAGASGRMGASLLRMLPDFPSIRLRAALCGPASTRLGRDSGEAIGLPANGISLTTGLASALEGAGLVLDFSVPSAASAHLQACAAAGVPLLLGSTGHGPDLAGEIDSAARLIPILVAPNTSLGAAVLMGLARRAAEALGEGYDVAILDWHHRGKRDAPSGTAMALGAAVDSARRGRTKVDYASIRGGDTVGHHELRFSGLGESIHLSHDVTNRAVFAHGALRAGLWLSGQAPGRYDMTDLIEEK